MEFVPARSPWRRWFRPRAGAHIPAAFRLVFAAASGAALSLCFTGFYFPIYSWFTLALLLLMILDARPRLAFACGFLHAFFFVLTSLPWIATVLAVHGGLSLAGGWGILLLIAGVWGLLTGTFAWSVRRVAYRSIALACLASPFLWVAIEFARAHLPEIGFPWNLLGYPASANLGLLQIVSITGIWGLSFLVAAFNALLAWTYFAPTPLPGKRIMALATATAVLLIVAIVAPRLVPEDSAKHFARAVQTNFPEVMEYPPNWFVLHSQEMSELEKLSLAPGNHRTDLLVWPEAPAPFSMEDPQFASVASLLAIHFQHPFLAGVIEWRPAPGAHGNSHTPMAAYNSAVLLDSQGQNVFTYDKVHLVPFGEYEPFPLIHSVVASLSGEVGGFRKGAKYSVARLPGGFEFGTFICYEAIFPGEVRHFAANGANLYINISNDGWFGRSAAPEQHLRMARVRAAENHRWLMRVTNNGFTASIDPYGRIFRALPTDVRVAVDLPYDFRTDETIYTRYGDWFAWLCVIVSAILLVTTIRKRKTAGQELLIPIGDVPPTLVPSG